MLSGDRLFCLFIEDYLVGDQFSDWPLHITLVPWFRTDVAKDILISDANKLLAEHKTFKLTVKGEDKFGKRKSKLVNLIEDNSELIPLEKDLRQLLKGYSSWIVDESTRQKLNFRPHISVQKSERVYEGDELKINAVYLVEQKGKYKEVAAVIKLKND